MKTVSIVIPTRNEEKHIEKCLDSVIAADYPKELLSVIICDGCSNDSTPQLIASYTEKHPYITVIRNLRMITPFGLNLGINYTNSDVVIILGGHSIITPDYISKCVENLDRDPKIGCVGGIVENIGENDISRIIGYAMSQSFGAGPVYFRTGAKEGYVDTIAFGAYKREVFEKIGCFDTNLIRDWDDEFNFRLNNAGYKIYLSKQIKSYHYVVRSSFQKLYKQYFQYGYWKVYANKKHKKLTSSRQLLPFLFVCFLFGGLFFSFFSNIIAYSYIGVILLYLLFACIFSFRVKIPFRQRFQLIYCFITLHIGYGMGYSSGISDFFISKIDPNRKMGEMTR